LWYSKRNQQQFIVLVAQKRNQQVRVVRKAATTAMGSPKKVEFASTHLEAIDSEGPSNAAAPWDTETGAFVATNMAEL